MGLGTSTGHVSEILNRVKHDLTKLATWSKFSPRWHGISVYWCTVWSAGGALVFVHLLLLHYCLGLVKDRRQLHGQQFSHVV